MPLPEEPFRERKYLRRTQHREFPRRGNKTADRYSVTEIRAFTAGGNGGFDVQNWPNPVGVPCKEHPVDRIRCGESVVNVRTVESHTVSSKGIQSAQGKLRLIGIRAYAIQGARAGSEGKPGPLSVQIASKAISDRVGLGLAKRPDFDDVALPYGPL